MSTSTDIRTPRAQRRAARRTAQYLITADENSFAELQAHLATLPICASGRIFIEVAEPSDISVIEVPGRMTVTWLARSSRSGAPGTGRSCAPGTALARATCAWADEMLCDGDGGTQITLLGGFLGTADIVEHLTVDLRVPTTSIDAPERFGLLPR